MSASITTASEWTAGSWRTASHACSAPNVYTAGDVAVTFDPITGGRIVTGLWTNAVEMGRCAGFNMAGKPVEYGGTFGILNATQVADVSFVSMGIVHTKGLDYETHVSGSSGAYRKLVNDKVHDHLAHLGRVAFDGWQVIRKLAVQHGLLGNGGLQ